MDTIRQVCELSEESSTGNWALYGTSWQEILPPHAHILKRGLRLNSKGDRLNCLEKEVAQQCSIQPVIWLVLSAFNQSYGEKEHVGAACSLAHGGGWLGLK